jgi:DNA-binding MarR family transcriptional regulator
MATMTDPAPNFDDAGRLRHELWQVGARVLSLSEAALAETPLSPASASVLNAISAKPGTSIAEVARWLPTTAQAVSQIVARLERLGLVERRLGARGHGVALFPTPEGDRAREDADRRVAFLEARLADALGPEDHASLLALLGRARTVVERFEATAKPASQATAPKHEA